MRRLAGRRLARAVMAVMTTTLPAFPAPPAAADTGWTLVARYPHDRAAFTEGLFFADGILFESTGQPGRSDLRQVRLKDGKVLRRVALEPRYFGEGIVAWNGRIISLTWQDQTGWVWDARTLKRERSWTYAGEGWALTQDGRQIIMSDGTPQLRFLNPVTLAETHRVTVTWRGQPVRNINELEYVRGEVLANVWMTNRIARIDPATGVVRDFIDLTALAAKVGASDPDAVLNGIAYDGKADRLFVTGKYWPSLFEIRLKR